MINVLVPTRGRPQRALETFRSFNLTKRSNSRIIFGLDYNEPHMIEYEAVLGDYIVYAPPAESGSFGRVTNYLARKFPADILGSVGDDHRFRTTGWDTHVERALRDYPGVAYANDLFQRERLPTAAFVSGIIVERLGWFANPKCEHMYIDNTWKDIGEALDSLHYLPDVVIEHMHYAAQKSNFDQHYARTEALKGKDRLAYEAWNEFVLPLDIERITRDD